MPKKRTARKKEEKKGKDISWERERWLFITLAVAVGIMAVAGSFVLIGGVVPGPEAIRLAPGPFQGTRNYIEGLNIPDIDKDNLVEDIEWFIESIQDEDEVMAEGALNTIAKLATVVMPSDSRQNFVDLFNGDATVFLGKTTTALEYNGETREITAKQL